MIHDHIIHQTSYDLIKYEILPLLSQCKDLLKMYQDDIFCFIIKATTKDSWEVFTGHYKLLKTTTYLLN